MSAEVIPFSRRPLDDLGDTLIVYAKDKGSLQGRAWAVAGVLAMLVNNPDAVIRIYALSSLKQLCQPLPSGEEPYDGAEVHRLAIAPLGEPA